MQRSWTFLSEPPGRNWSFNSEKVGKFISGKITWKPFLLKWLPLTYIKLIWDWRTTSQKINTTTTDIMVRLVLPYNPSIRGRIDIGLRRWVVRRMIKRLLTSLYQILWNLQMLVPCGLVNLFVRGNPLTIHGRGVMSHWVMFLKMSLVTFFLNMMSRMFLTVLLGIHRFLKNI